MSMEDQIEGPPWDEANGGPKEISERAATDGQENRPNGDCPQDDSAPAPAFDPDAIWAHIQMLFALAQSARGKFVAIALTGDKAEIVTLDIGQHVRHVFFVSIREQKITL